MEDQGYKPPPSQSTSHTDTAMAHITYGAEAWTLSKDLQCNTEAFEMQCYRRSMKISCRDHVMNEMVLDRVDQKRKLLSM